MNKSGNIPMERVIMKDRKKPCVNIYEGKEKIHM